MTTPNPRVVFAKFPGDGLPVAGQHISLDHSRTLDLDRVSLNGGFLTKTLILSPEPALRERMRESSIPSYSTSYHLGTTIIGFGLVVVIRSEKEGVAVGDYMYGQTPWEAYTVQPYVEGRINFKPDEWTPYTFDMDSLALTVVPDPAGAFPLTRYCSVLGTPGLSAFEGFEKLIAPFAKEESTIFVSSGASGVGNMVVQLAKLKGMKVITSVGSDAKVAYVKSLGADVGFNYKTEGYASALSKFGPINFYWDNVGGSALEAAIDAAAFHARIVCCGSSEDYNRAREERHGIKNTTLIFKKRLTIEGFLVPDFFAEFAQRFFAEIPALVAQGKLKSEESIVEGIENAPKAFVDMLEGTVGVGKPLVIVAKN